MEEDKAQQEDEEEAEDDVTQNRTSVNEYPHFKNNINLYSATKNSGDQWQS